MYSLSRVGDLRGDSGGMSQAIKWKEDGTVDEIVSDRPTLGCSMRVGSITARSYSDQDWWLTTEVTEILIDEVDYVKFKTGNSLYEWRARSISRVS